jgi:choline-glycine betaine transporter
MIYIAVKFYAYFLMLVCAAGMIGGILNLLLGLIIIAAAIAYIFIVQDSKVFQFAILLVVGIGFLFAPDTIVDGLRSLIKNNKNKKF